MTTRAKVCRICMTGTTKGVISLFSVCNGSIRIYDKVMEVANVQISEEDGLPVWICYSCLVHLETSYQFKIQAEKSDQLFRNQLEASQKEADVVVIDDNTKSLQAISNTGVQCIMPSEQLPFSVGQKPSVDIESENFIHENTTQNDENTNQEHFMSLSKGMGDDHSNDQNGIKITNVMSQAEQEVMNMPCTETCTCIEGQDGTITSKCEACTKISSARGTDGGVCDTSYDDMCVSKDCINKIIEYVEQSEQSLSTDSMYSYTKCEYNFASGEFNEQSTQKRKREFECHVCNKVFTCTSSLNTHVLTHKEVEPCICTLCGYVSTSSNPANRKRNMRCHMLIHGNQITFKCDICGKPFGTMKQLKDHEGIHDSVRPYKCDQCGKAFIRKQGLRNHKLVHLDHKLKSKKKHECHICDTVFDSEESVENHLLTHPGVKPYKCKECSYATYNNGSIKKHLLTHSEEKPFTCGTCAKSFTSQYCLKKHTLVHSTEKPYKCDQCDKAFLYKEALKYHKIDHSGQVRNPCKHCGKGHKYKSLLKLHEESHAGPIRCGICSKEFKTKSGLTGHNKVQHSGEKPNYICEICGKAFMLLSLLKSHKTMHPEGNPMECDICHKMFPHKRSLRVHRRLTHADGAHHQCNICGKKFKHQSTLHFHTKTLHTSGAEKFNCSICEAVFTQKSALNTHTKIIHKGIEPHACKLCGQTFKWKQTFDKHKYKCAGKDNNIQLQHSVNIKVEENVLKTKS